jgi:hypothetical protein
VLVIFNSAAIVASLADGVKGSATGCNNNQCHTLISGLTECYHKNIYENGDPCHPQGCMITSIIRYSCLSDESEEPCRSEYDQHALRVYQIVRAMGSCSSVATVTWNNNTLPGNACTPSFNYSSACEASSCNGEQLHVEERHGRNVCKK